ncbi:MAG: AI-2E family transporter [Candidatus Paceibacterota bacterium]
MSIARIVEYVFFFLLLVASGYLVWQVFSPFVSALALSLIIVTICYPMYTAIKKYIPRQNESLAALITTLIVVVLIVIPIFFVSTIFLKELISFYQTLGSDQNLTIEQYLTTLEDKISIYVPEFQINLTEQLRQSAGWFVGSLGSIFAGTLTTVFVILISLIGSFYFFKDGRELLSVIAKISPLPDREDYVIFSRLAIAVRSVATGVLLVSFLQGLLAAIGFTIFGIERAVLWGAVAAILAMLPGIGTITIMIPAVIYLFMTSSVFAAIGLAIWAVVVVVVVDNMIGPYLMSRGNNMHPFLMLLSVLGGISMFGPIGFIVGPVIVTLFIVLLEIYNQYIVKSKQQEIKQ